MSYLCGDHRDLHSFPTRRSSDLRQLQSQVLQELVAAQDRQREAAEASVVLPEQLGRHGFGGRGERSEEHTSELQSRENLVCRLLLEKKNKTHPPNSGDTRKSCAR